MPNNKINIFDRKLLKIRRDRSVKSLKNSDFLIKFACEDLADRIFDNKIDSLLEIGCRAGGIASYLQDKEIGFYTKSDLSFKMLKNNNHTIKVSFDEELLPFKNESFNMVVSPVNLHWVNDLPGCLVQIRKVLKKDGMVFLSFFGYQTLSNIRQLITNSEIEVEGGVSARFPPLIDVKSLGALAQRVGFKDIICDSNIVNVQYENIFKLFEDIRAMGESNLMHKGSKYFSKELLNKVATNYSQLYVKNKGELTTAFEIVTLTATI